MAGCNASTIGRQHEDVPMDQMAEKPASSSRPTVDAPIIPISRRRFVQGLASAVALSSGVFMAACQSPTAAPTAPPAPATSPAAPASVAPTATSPAPTTAALSSPTVTSAAATPSVAASTATPAPAATASPVAPATVAPAAQPAVTAGKPMYQVDALHTGRSPHTGPTHGVALR